MLPFLPLAITAPIFSRNINAFLASINLLFPFSGIITSVSDLIIAADDALAFAFGIKTTENGLSEPCQPVTVIFARGTSEPGNVGVLVGPPFFDALKSKIGGTKVVMQGVPYPASVEGFLKGGDPAGSQTMYDANLSLLCTVRSARSARADDHTGPTWSARPTRNVLTLILSWRRTRRAGSCCIRLPRCCRPAP